jgi:chromate transporter
MTQQHTPTPTGTLGEVARVFLRLGATAFGGPAAHIGLFQQELVQRKAWVTNEHFLDLLGVTNMIPGPNSTEMAIHLGHVRAGWKGAIVAGVCFILPAAVLVLILAALYVQVGTTPAANGLLYGVKPVIIAIVAHALYGLLGKALKNPPLIVVGVAAVALYLLGANEIVVLFGLGALYLAYQRVRNRQSPLSVWLLPLFAQVGAAVTVSAVSLPVLFFNFLKIGAVLYGSGYVLLAFIRSDFVDGLGWLTNQQLLDAVAVGQFTPGPLFTTATFVGYLVGDSIGQGVLGAILATVGIFLPSFVFVLLTNPLIPRMRRQPVLSLLLDGVNAAALGLMAGVTVELGISALIDPLTIALAVASLAILIRFKVNATWLIVAGALIGLLAKGL